MGVVRSSFVAGGALVALLAASASVRAEVIVTESSGWKAGQKVAKAQKATAAKPDKAARKAAAARRAGRPTGQVAPLATGSQALVDGSGLEYFINTNITFSTSSSASAAMSEASYTGPVAATTLNGGTVQTTLNDAFDGYNTACLGLNGATGSCQTGNASYLIYNQNGAATTDCGGRQVVFPVKSMNGLNVSRKVYVPANDTFARWQNILSNPTGSPITVNLIVANNLGSDSNTIITGSSSGNAGAEVSDTWVATMQNYSGTTSSDVRLGHVLRGTGTPNLAFVNFANGDDNPYWGYTVTVQPGTTQIILNFISGQPSKAAAAAKAAELAASPLPPNAVACMTAGEQAQVVNFGALQIPNIPTLGFRGLLGFAFATAILAFALLRRLV